MGLIEKLFKRVDYNICWDWMGAKDDKGYGQIRIGNKIKYTHRVSYEYLELDHLCRNPLCLRPSHLEAVTHKINCQRGISGNSKKCKDPSKAWCVTCQKIYGRENFHKNKTRWNGLCGECKKCINARSKIYTEQNRENINKRRRERRKNKNG